jgi:hypothetical protein
MISSTLGAPLGGTTRGGQYGLDCRTLRSILPPNVSSGIGGSCLPSIVVVALGEPGTPVVSTVSAVTSVAEVLPMKRPNTAINRHRSIRAFIVKNVLYTILLLWASWVKIYGLFIPF